MTCFIHLESCERDLDRAPLRDLVERDLGFLDLGFLDLGLPRPPASLLYASMKWGADYLV